MSTIDNKNKFSGYSFTVSYADEQQTLTERQSPGARQDTRYRGTDLF